MGRIVASALRKTMKRVRHRSQTVRLLLLFCCSPAANTRFFAFFFFFLCELWLVSFLLPLPLLCLLLRLLLLFLSFLSFLLFLSFFFPSSSPPLRSPVAL